MPAERGQLVALEVDANAGHHARVKCGLPGMAPFRRHGDLDFLLERAPGRGARRGTGGLCAALLRPVA